MSYGQFNTRGDYGYVRSYSRTLGRAIVLAVPRNIYEQKNPAAVFTTHRLSGAERTARVLAGLDAGTSNTQSTLRVRAAVPTAPIQFHATPIVEGPFALSAGPTPAPASATPISAPASPSPSTQPTITTQPSSTSRFDQWQWRAQQEASQAPPSGYSYPPSSAQAAYPGETWTDPGNGNVWAWNGSSWSFIQPGATTGSGPGTYATPLPSQPIVTPTNVALQSTGGGATAQAGTPVPVGWPTNQPYTDSSGNIWTYTATGGWQITGTSTSAAAGTDWFSELTTWLQSSSLISGIQNFWIVAGAAGVGLLLYKPGRH